MDEKAPVVVTHSLESGRHPFELFVLILGVVAGLPLMIEGPTPGSTQALLGNGLIRVWGAMFGGGCLIALIGVLWAPIVRRVRGGGRATSGLLIEQVGLVAVGFGTIIYAIGLAVAPNGTPSRYVPLGLVLALGIASFWRAVQIQRWVHALISVTREIKG